MTCSTPSGRASSRRSSADGDGAALVRDADAAMYRAKQLGRSRSELYEPGRVPLIPAPR